MLPTNDLWKVDKNDAPVYLHRLNGVGAPVNSSQDGDISPLRLPATVRFGRRGGPSGSASEILPAASAEALGRVRELFHPYAAPPASTCAIRASIMNQLDGPEPTPRWQGSPS
jgi:hypothetical protein